MKKKIASLSLAFCLLFTCSFAHSGRTDSSGGHRDNNNVSGLGYYHYHCGGNPPHLHNNGVCPYKISYTSLTQTHNYSGNTATTNTQTITTSPTTEETSKFEVTKTTYPVKINNQDISNFTLGWPSFIYENITYIPMTSYLINELNLNLDFNSETGLNLSNKNSQSVINSDLKYKELFLASSLLYNLDKSLTTTSAFFRDCYKDYYLAYLDKNLSGGFQNSKELLGIAVASVNSYYENRELIVDICVRNNIATLDEMNEMFNNIQYYPYCLQMFADNMSSDITNNLPYKEYTSELSLCDKGLIDINNTMQKIQINISSAIIY
jgi:translation initiation factor 2 beta subunit (eIF-2beta)/eIF-5